MTEGYCECGGVLRNLNTEIMVCIKCEQKYSTKNGENLKPEKARAICSSSQSHYPNSWSGNYSTASGYSSSGYSSSGYKVLYSGD